jgi:ABC-type nitrate/sulfonate/bicarbonate transport system ATPase subunit
MNYTTTETILYLDKLCVGYPDTTDPSKTKTILKDISLVEKDIIREGHAATGQTIAFLGRSGRGKSTLFKVLTGLLKPTSGHALITNLKTSDVTDAKEIEEGDVGFVDQKYTLFRHKTITQIFKYALRKNKMSDSDKNAIISKYLNEWGLEEHKDKYPSELSGGQRQRTAIIEQMLTSKHFMVFDEPFSGLDVGNIEKVKDSFQKILSDNELNTIIFSTHDIRLAVELADSIYVIGHPVGVSDYSTIIKHYDLKEKGLAWQPYGEEHRKITSEIKQILINS